MSTMVERARGKLSAGRSIMAGLTVLAVVLTVSTLLHRYGFSGLALDQGAVRNWLEGNGLYAYRDPRSHLGAALPPAAAFLLVPFAFLPLGLAGWLTALAGLAALVLALIALAGPVARRYGRSRRRIVLVGVLLALTLEPVRATLGLGRLDLILFGLITADVVALRRGAWARSRAAWWPGRPASAPPRGRPFRHLLQKGWATGAWAGVGIGVATALAVGPGLFIGYLAVTRQWRAAFTALGTALILAVGAMLAAPSETAAWFGEVLWRLDRTGGIDLAGNQSLAGVLARIYHSPTTPVLLWLSFSLVLIAVGMTRARSAHLDGDEIAAFTLIGLTSAIVGPVTSANEVMWVLPAILILLDAAARKRLAVRRPRPRWYYPAAAAVATYLLFVLDPVWNSYALALTLLVCALPWRPGVAPAFPINRWIGQRRPAIPPARRPMGS